MTHSPPPDDWQELMAGYALGDLSSEEAEAVQQLLAAHPHLSSEIDQYQEVLALMPYALPDREPPPQLRQAILAQAEAEPPSIGLFQTAHPARLTRPARPLPWKSLGGAIAALFLLAIALDHYRLRQQVQTSQQTIGRLQQEIQTTAALTAALQQPGAQLYPLAGTEKAAIAAGSLIMVPGQQRAVMVVQNLPTLPTDRAYRLWAITENATQPVLCGEFNPGVLNSETVNGRAIATWGTPDQICTTTVNQMLITTEAIADPPVPRGDLVMESKG
ncbi:MAG: anti-sigma factor [Oculatellaceae cyanobacterium Prado106]|jgi:anti-sigma-K factor RskA|nr:anti-sigma factor [Oculatellaceae cyanobacterium Prado106]